MISKKPILLTLLTALALAAGSFYYLRSQSDREDTSPSTPQDQGEESPKASPLTGEARYPVPGEDESSEGDATTGAPLKGTAARLPAVDDSDPVLNDQLTRLFGESPITRVFNLKDIIRRFVVTVNNLPEQRQLSQEFSLLRSPDGDFLTVRSGSSESIDPKNYARYSPYVTLFASVGTRKAVGEYVHFYPLFQSAYRDLGSQGYFNDRVVAAIDNLLDAPDPPEPVQLTLKNAVHRKFKDPSLEALSVGQKAMIRIGPENRRQVEEKLRELRARLVHLTRPDQK